MFDLSPFGTSLCKGVLQYTAPMKTREEKNWELIQQLLAAEVSGQTPRHVSSTRTLFGIKSSVEEVIDRVVAEDEARLRAERAARRAASDGDSRVSADAVRREADSASETAEG